VVARRDHSFSHAIKARCAAFNARGAKIVRQLMRHTGKLVSLWRSKLQRQSLLLAGQHVNGVLASGRKM